MHTIESSILIPFGLGLVVLMLMLAFYLHDQTVLTAEYASTMLEWQMRPGKWDEEMCEEEAMQWESALLITEVDRLKMKAGNVAFSLKTQEVYRLFGGVLGLLEQNLPSEQESSISVLLKIDPFWLRRIWKVVEAI